MSQSLLITIQVILALFATIHSTLGIASKKATDSNICHNFDYSPCWCKPGKHQGSLLSVTCNRVAISEIYNMFHNGNSELGNNRSIDQFNLVLKNRNESGSIPADLMGGKHFASSLYLACADLNQQLQMDPSALNSSRATMAQLSIANCDLTRLEFEFLSGFSRLTHLTIDSSRNIHLSGFGTSFPPQLPRLSSIRIFRTSGLMELMPLPQLSEGLDSFSLVDQQGEVEDSTASRILDWLLYNSTDRLSRLTLSGGRLTHIPEQIPLFEKLSRLDLSDNVMPLEIPSKSLTFKAPVLEINLSGSRIENIGPGPFKGDFSKARIDLRSNNLTRLEGSVFQEVLKQMASSNGTLFLHKNPIDCVEDPCHLAWLMRDDQLQKHVKGGRCSDGTNLADLDDIECPIVDEDIKLYE